MRKNLPIRHQVILRYLIVIFSFLFFNLAYADDATSPAMLKQFVVKAVRYALENKDPKMDYSKYVSKKFINPIDGAVFNYTQWVHHQRHIKRLVKSMKPNFVQMIAEGNKVAAIYYINLIKNNGSHLLVKDIAFFTIKNNKIIYCEELTRLIKGDIKDKNIGSTQ